MKYIKTMELDSYYEDIYKKEINGYISEEEHENKTVEESIDDVISLLDTSEKIINFLSDNKDSWTIEDESVVFNTQKLSDEYEKMADEI